MFKTTAVALAIVLGLSALPAAASADDGVRKVRGPHETCKVRKSERSTDVRKVRKTRKVTRHYKRSHGESSHSNSLDAALFFVDLLAWAVVAASEAESQAFNDKYTYTDAEVYEDDEWAGDESDTSFVVRVNTGMSFRFLEPYDDEAQSGVTYGLRAGFGGKLGMLSLTVEMDDFSRFGGRQIWTFRPGIDLVISPVDESRAIRPYIGGGLGGFFDTGPDALDVAGVTIDLEGGVSIFLTDQVDVALGVQFDLLGEPYEDEYGESSLDPIGLRTAVTLSTGLVF